jgi:MoaA/NifB/PqqE/SkfB family radical SAM enzyme
MSDLLQTSPYVTCFTSGQPSPIVFAVDEIEPVFPDVNPPDGAAFGVIELDRKVVWHKDLNALDALQHAASVPVARQSLIESYGAQVVSDLVGRGWLQRPEELCREYFLTSAQIEVTAHCNWGCSFCPVSTDRKPKATMPMPLFEEIIEKISPYNTIRCVTFHFFNEPTLDPFFEERVAVLQSYRLPLWLFTNATRLTDRKIEMLKRSGVLGRLVVNLPALQEEDFRALTQSKTTYAVTIHNVDAAIAAGLPVEIWVSGIGEELTHRLSELREIYEPRGVSVKATTTSDRAGALSGQYNQAIRIEGPLTGCAWPVNHAYFSVTGEMFICCNDYYQREKFGNIRSGSVHEIMTSPAAILLRQRVFGVANASADYVCRSCHDQLIDFPRRQFRPLASFPVRKCCRMPEAVHE